ncbi:hypothetical protein FE782_11440 [Paenibacillus antri]|uniref:Uncharacterized protein n=1 Tax=Paenibacillus antri TaxID=2582848 RepID=A0A5R9G6H9_9BACL|nr:hypothetical protein [Paenibacillus antri]TLS51987.1 hypothetical protein FE782_11440 [Paenibacillus antri]
MLTYNVRDAFQVLKERGIARDKQEVRKWLNEGYIEAEPPENRRIGWKIRADALQRFIERYEVGDFQGLMQRRKTTIPALSLEARPLSEGEPKGSESQLFRLEEEMTSLRQQVRALRREMNDLKKVLGFPVLAAAQTSDEKAADS